MSERKVLNKYYPPDFDPSKIPRMKLAKNRQYTVRLMAPFNMRCKTCGEYIYKGKKFNARKEDVEHETYLGIRIYRFYIKCTRCLQEISFKTDPKNTDYEIEAGATRNFMALKLAEEQAKREEDEIREEEQNNPMKLLENRTQQSRNEIEMLESLEELRDLNKRQHAVDYETMLQQYNNSETERERLERQEREDEAFIKSVKFQNQPKNCGKIVAEEVVEIVKESKCLGDDEPRSAKLAKTTTSSTISSFKTSTSVSPKFNSMSNLVKRKQQLVIVRPKTQASDMETRSAKETETEKIVKSDNLTKTDSVTKRGTASRSDTGTKTDTYFNTDIVNQIATVAKSPETIVSNSTAQPKAMGLSLLAAYSDYSEDDST